MEYILFASFVWLAAHFSNSSLALQFAIGAWAYLMRISLVIARIFVEPRFVDAGVAAGFLDGGENIFGANVADQIVAGERAAAEAGECAIEAAAAGVVGGEDFGLGVFRAAVQVSAEFDSCDVLVRAFKNVADDFWSGIARSVGERNGSARECLSAIREFPRPVPVPTVHRKDCRRPSKCKSPGHVRRLWFLC